MNILESSITAINATLEQKSNVIVLSAEGGNAICKAYRLLHQLYENAQAITDGESINGWEINTLDYQTLEDLLYKEELANA